MPRDNAIRRYCRLYELSTYTLAISDEWADLGRLIRITPHTPTSSVVTRLAAAVVASVTIIPKCSRHSPFQRVGVRAGRMWGARESLFIKG